MTDIPSIAIPPPEVVAVAGRTPRSFWRVLLEVLARAAFNKTTGVVVFELRLRDGKVTGGRLQPPWEPIDDD